jgi:hypothetical protein
MKNISRKHSDFDNRNHLFECTSDHKIDVKRRV